MGAVPNMGLGLRGFRAGAFITRIGVPLKRWVYQGSMIRVL